MKPALAQVRKVNFDTCTVCNHVCSFCPNPDRRTVKNILSAADFRVVMEDVCSETGIEELGLSAKGEPLLNPQLPEIVALAKRTFKIPYVYISTNGSLLSRRLLETLLDAGLDSVKFSINAFTREDYRAVHGKDHFQRVLANLADAVELRRQRRFNLLTSSVTERDEAVIRERLGELIGDLAGDIRYVLRYNQDFRPMNGRARAAGLPYAACPYLFREVYIDADCDLIACCIDYFGEIRFGNLKERRLAELWQGEAFERLRGMHAARTLPEDHLCYRCLTYEQDMIENERHIENVLKDKRS